LSPILNYKLKILEQKVLKETQEFSTIVKENEIKNSSFLSLKELTE